MDEHDRSLARRKVGARGEDAAALYLHGKGCTIIARNWHAHPGEIDIIARCPVPGAAPTLATTYPSSVEKESVLAFIEVRTRHGREGLAGESVAGHKAASMVSAAYSYMAAHDLDPEATPWRIDLVAIAMAHDKITSLHWARGVLEEQS